MNVEWIKMKKSVKIFLRKSGISKTPQIPQKNIRGFSLKWLQIELDSFFLISLKSFIDR